ncbi:MAG: hypothetical protein BMS9Abin28_1143 [Anaerolineae bacterium]|nr:MAG: hypothetical protein BMS9Abin28_1143 [Anaerolineae bacterium]
MSSRLNPTLSRKVTEYAFLGIPGLLLTIDDEGFPHSSFTWVVATSPDRLRFGADHGGMTLANIKRAGLASVQIIVDEGQPYLIKGNVTMASLLIQSAPFEVALMEMEILEVRDQSWIGVSVRPFDYDWAPEEREKMLEVEQAVYAEMREWSG